MNDESTTGSFRASTPDAEGTEAGPTRLRVAEPSTETIGESRTMSADEATHRRDIEKMRLDHEQKQEDAKRQHEEKKELDTLHQQRLGQYVSMIIVVIIAASCLWIIVSNKYTEGTVEKAAAALLLILGGFVGFITGQATKKQ